MKRAGVSIGVLGLGAAVLWALGSSRTSSPAPTLPSDDWQTAPEFTEADVEAASRMIASENPHGSEQLHIEQIWTQLRSRKPGQSLFDRITAGSGFGGQGERAEGGGTRPVSTTESATPEQRRLAREVLAGKRASKLSGARKYFEPAAQDRAFAIAEQARTKRSRGEALTAQEQRLRKYEKNAKAVRDNWRAEGARLVDTVDGVEFFT